MKKLIILFVLSIICFQMNAQLGTWSLTGNSVGSSNYLGTTNNEDLVFKRNGVVSGRIGVNNVSFGIYSFSSNTTGNYNIAVGFSAGSNNSSGSNNIYIGRGAFQSNATGSGNVIIGNNVTTLGNVSNHIYIADGDGAVAIEVNDESKVIIGGVSTPGDYRLYVVGGILTERVKVALSATSDWADYVFEEDYVLRPLSELEKFIKEKKHLPGVPSAENLVKGGIDLGVMQAKQMEKIEELILYVIQLKKEIDELKSKKGHHEKE
ncbi:MAG: hypothetical protein JKY22_01500 [Flavobacteriaceae bacterium]|nr:hypothetical protein [Flavobacteriaceae bacterium]